MEESAEGGTEAIREVRNVPARKPNVVRPVPVGEHGAIDRVLRIRATLALLEDIQVALAEARLAQGSRDPHVGQVPAFGERPGDRLDLSRMADVPQYHLPEMVLWGVAGLGLLLHGIEGPGLV